MKKVAINASKTMTIPIIQASNTGCGKKFGFPVDIKSEPKRQSTRLFETPAISLSPLQSAIIPITSRNINLETNQTMNTPIADLIKLKNNIVK